MSTEIDPHKALKVFVARYSTQAVAADALGIKPSYLTDLIHKRRPFSARILKRLGLRRAVVAE